MLYASLWATRRPPWSVYAPTNLPGGGLYKSTDGGDTWKQLTGGLPNDRVRRQDRHRGRAQQSQSPLGRGRRSRSAVAAGNGGGGRRGAAAADAADARRAAPCNDGGVYISDDAGATWKLVNSENRLWGRGWYFESVTVDPTNPDRAYVINTATYMTTDGGKTFVPIKGAPGGDDYHQMWVNPKDGNRMVLSQRSGHRSQRGWRQELEHLVQPAHRADLSRRRRQSLPLLALRRAAGFAAAWASAPGRARACSPSATGSPPASPARATPWFPIRKTATFSTAAAPAVAISL